MEAATGEAQREKRARQTPNKPGEEQPREVGWSHVECCPKAAEDEADEEPSNVVLSQSILCFLNLILFCTVKVAYVFFLV